MQQIKREFEKYSKKMQELEAFRVKHGDILLENFRLEEEARMSEFTIKEKIDMWIDEGSVKEDVFLEDDLIEWRVKPAEKKIQLFFKKFYQKDNPELKNVLRIKDE